MSDFLRSLKEMLREAAAWWRVAGQWPDSAELAKRMKEAETAPVTSGYVHRVDIPPSPPGVLTTTAKPGDPTLWIYPDVLPQTWGVTTTTYKRKRRPYRQVVY